MKKLILILALMFCLIFSVNTLAFEKVDVTGTNFDTTAIFVAKIQTFLDHGLGTSTTVVAYEEGEPILQVWGTCDSVDGATTANPVYVHSILTGTGAVGRAAEFVLAPTAVMGSWGNAVKGYLDLTGSAGSYGLLSGICAEVKFPPSAMMGTIGGLEIELVAPGSFVASAGVGTNCLSFIYAQASGAQVTEIDNHGYFLNLQGLTPLEGNLLSANHLTLKIAVNALTKYLLLSHKEDGLSSGTDAAPIEFAATGGMNAEVYSNFTLATAGTHSGLNVDVIYTPGGNGVASVYGIRGTVEVATGTTLNEASYQQFAGIRGHVQITGTLSGAGVWISSVLGTIGPSAPTAMTTFKTMAAFTACSLLQADPGTGDYAGFVVANAGGYRWDYGFLGLEAMRYGVGLRPNKADSVLESGIILDATNVSMVYNVIELVDAVSINYFLKTGTAGGCVSVNTNNLSTDTLQHVIVVNIDGDPGYIPILDVAP